jgi:hypothetical protein
MERVLQVWLLGGTGLLCLMVLDIRVGFLVEETFGVDIRGPVLRPVPLLVSPSVLLPLCCCLCAADSVLLFDSSLRFCSGWPSSRLAITERALSNSVEETGLLCFSDLVGETGQLSFSNFVVETGQLSFFVLIVDSSVLYSLTSTWLQGDLATLVEEIGMLCFSVLTIREEAS